MQKLGDVGSAQQPQGIELCERIRLLAVDMDGTLLTSDRRILPEVVSAFAAARKSGLPIVPASARSPAALKHLLAELGHSGPCICFSGAWAGDIEANGTVTNVDLSRKIIHQTALAIALAAEKKGLVPNWYTEDQWFVSRISPAVERLMRSTRQTPLPVDGFDRAPPPNKILIVGERVLLDELTEHLDSRQGLELDWSYSHSTYLEIMPKGADKLVALLRLASRFGIAIHEISAVGDADNDLRMVESVGFGVAMGNGTLAVREAARWVTSSNDEAGVAVLIRKLLAARAEYR